MPSEILANVIRGETVESIHRGHFIVIDGDEQTVASAGEPSTVTYYRSAAKPFQAIPMITSGAADAFGFTDDEIAMAAASHSGEPMHVERVARMLGKLGLTESDLRCGKHKPFYGKVADQMLRDGEPPTQLHNNCSGKHTAMLALAKHIGADLATYDAYDNRAQQRILRCVSDFSGTAQADIALGLDGCAAPNFAIPLDAMAKSFVNLVNPKGLHPASQSAAKRVVDAMMKYPELIGGTGRLDTMIMQAAPGRVVSKVGADGVWLAAAPPSEKYPTGLGIALKIEDGDDHRARPVVAVELLRRFGVISNDDLTEISPMSLKNRRGNTVGRVEPRFGTPPVNK